MADPARDLAAKLELEADLARKRLGAQREIVRSAARQFATSGAARIQGLSEELMRPILEGHYDQVRGRFQENLREELPDDLVLTDEEARALETALAAAVLARAAAQAEVIAATDQADANRARLVLDSERERIGRNETRIITGPEAGIIGASVLERRMAGRTSAIAVAETTAVAELTKSAEARTLLGLDPIAAAGAVAGPPATKVWRSQGDSHVRAIHAPADGQEVLESEPFRVGGESLYYPGDTSLGATARNIANCRCSAIHNAAEIARLRSFL